MKSKRKIIPILVLGLAMPGLNAIADSKPLKLQDPKTGKFFTESEVARIQDETNTIKVNPAAAKRILPDWVHVEIKSRGGLNTYDPQMMDITQSYLGIMLGDDVLAYLNSIENVRKNTTVFSFNAKISLVPILLRSSVQDRAEEKIDEQGNLAKEGLLASTAIQIHNQIQALIEGGEITPEQGEVMEAQFLATAKNQINQAVDKKVKAAKNKVDERLDEVQKELTFQEVSIRVAHKLIEKDDGALIIFGQVGKDVVDLNFDANTGLRGASVFPQMGTRGMSVQPTAQGNVGFEWITEKNIKVSLQAFFFHGRIPLISGARGVYNIVNMPDAAYDQHTDLFNIDSNAQKFSVKMPSRVGNSEDQFYIATGSFATGKNTAPKQAVGGGVLVRVHPMVSIQVEGAFNRPQFDSMLTEAILIDNIDKDNRLTLYVAHENVNGLVSAYDKEASEPSADISSVTVGAKYLLYKFSKYGVKGQVSTNLEYKGIYESNGLTKEFDSGGGFGAGVQGGLNY
jgi:hypothetical protein